MVSSKHTIFSSFTVGADGLAGIIVSPIAIFPAFDPLKTTDAPDGHQFTALWDTGAMRSAVTPQVVQACGLKPIGMAKTMTAAGVHDTHVYMVNIGLPNGVGFYNVHVTEVPGIRYADVLIGMDVINQGDFAITNKDGKTICSFRIPSMEHIDFTK